MFANFEARRRRLARAGVVGFWLVSGCASSESTTQGSGPGGSSGASGSGGSAGASSAGSSGAIAGANTGAGGRGGAGPSCKTNRDCQGLGYSKPLCFPPGQSVMPSGAGAPNRADACASDLDCEKGSCTDGSCVLCSADSDCGDVDLMQCNPDSARCGRRACTSDCAGQMDCVNGWCTRRSCDTDADCKASGSCVVVGCFDVPGTCFETE